MRLERERPGQGCDEREARTLWRKKEMRNRENEERESGMYIKSTGIKKILFCFTIVLQCHLK